MRGDDQHQDAMWSYISPERRVPADHPLRPIREMVKGADHVEDRIRGAGLVQVRPRKAHAVGLGPANLTYPWLLDFLQGVLHLLGVRPR